MEHETVLVVALNNPRRAKLVIETYYESEEVVLVTSTHEKIPLGVDPHQFRHLLQELPIERKPHWEIKELWYSVPARMRTVLQIPPSHRLIKLMVYSPENTEFFLTLIFSLNDLLVRLPNEE